MSKKPPTKTAADFAAELQTDGRYKETTARGEAVREKARNELLAAQVPLLDALRAVGINVTSVWDLVNRVNNYDVALPILVQHLDRTYPYRVLEGIARALAMPAAHRFLELLMAKYVQLKKPLDDQARLKEALAAAISAASSDDDLHIISGLVADRENGPSRVLLLPVLRRSATAESRAALSKLRADPELAVEIASWQRDPNSDH